MSLASTVALAPRRVFFFVCLFGWIFLTEASTPNVIITVADLDEPQEWAAKRGLFGSEKATVTGELLRAPVSDPLLCNYFNPFRPKNETYVADPTRSATALGGKDIILLTPRGNCTFERKAWVAQEFYGAVGILVYDNVAARYKWNDTTQRVIFPREEEDFECEKGYGMVRNLTLDPPAYNEALVNQFIDRTKSTSTCELNVSNPDYSCESEYCLVTSHSLDSDEYPVCCAWDTHITMNVDKEFQKRDEIQKIMAVMITMRQAEQFLLFERRIITMTERKFNAWNLSMFLLWILATCITAYACWYSAQNYRYYRAKLAKIQGKKKKEESRNHQDGNIEFYDDNDDNGGGKRTHPERELDMNEDEDDEEDNTNDVEAVNVVEQNEKETTAQEQIEEYHDEPKNDDDYNDAVAPTETSKKKNKKKKLGKKKGNGATTLHSLPPSRSKARQEEEPPEIFTIYRRKKADNDDDDDQEEDEEKNNNKTFTLYSIPPAERKRPKKQRPNPDDIDNDLEDDEDDVEDPGKEEEPDDVANSKLGATEMSIHHVVLFVVVASAMLLILFFLNLYNVVCVIYGIGCAGSVSFLIFGPLIGKFVPKLGSEVVEELNKKVLCNLNGFDVISQGAGFIWAGIWLWYGLSHYRPSQNWFFWISLNIFGACFCIIMLSTFKINSLKIAALLGIAVFFYDIFFVFITPFLTGGSSIMLTVARGGAEAGATADDLCFKYPKHKDCTGIDFLPMLLAFPRIKDYRGGSSLLGLGDIVREFPVSCFPCCTITNPCRQTHGNFVFLCRLAVPGFLISFAARVR
jgi:hypothetical protein